MPVWGGAHRVPPGFAIFAQQIPRKFASFAADIHNDGWRWATGSPVTDLVDVADNMNKHGRALREELIRRISRQLLLAYMIEIPADPNNRVTVDRKYTDAIGIRRWRASWGLARSNASSIRLPRCLTDPASNEALRAEILSHDEFGPIARNIIKLWYTATWFELPHDWHEKFGLYANDRTFIPYTYAYPESLLGPAVGAHPAGAKPTGHSPGRFRRDNYRTRHLQYYRPT